MPVVREGVLVIYRGGQRIGEERYRDDGDAFASAIELAGKKLKVEVTRKARQVVVEANGQRVERALPAGTLALENGSFQAFALASEAFPEAVTDAPVSVLIPGQGATLEARITITARAEGGRRISLSLQGLEIKVELDASGQVERAAVPAQSLEVLREGVEPSAHVRAAPASVVAEPFEVTRDGIALRGELWLPKGTTGKPPVVLFIAGSGPTDRDGNSAMGLKSDAYRALAEALAARGIASLRFDKRGVGASSINFDPAKLVLGDFVADANALAAALRKDPRFASLALLGHSEGGLIALSIAADKAATPIDSLILVATAGRPLATVLHEQLARQLDATLLAAADKAIADLRAGKPLDAVPKELGPLFAPAVHTFLKSELFVDPVPLLAGIKAKTLVVQGEHDAQVSLEDAKKLAKARAGVTLKTFPKMSHVLKDEASAKLPQASYSDPTLPLSAGLADAIAAALR